MKSRLKFKPIGLSVLCIGMSLGVAAYAQDTNTQATTTTTTTTKSAAKASGASGQDQYPDLIEIDPFGGVSTYGQVQRGLTTKLVNGGVGGLRLAYNPSAYLGLELWADFDQANVEFRQSSGFFPGTISPLPAYSFGARNYFFGLNPIINLKPRGSKFQPYVTVGVNGIQFSPTDAAKSQARNPATDALFHSANLNDNLQVGLNYGGGVKWHFSDHFGVRVDARGFWSRNPTYGLANYPNGGIYIPAHDKLNGFQGTIGLVWYAGTTKCPEMPPAPPAPAPLPTPTISGAEGSLCPGKPVTLHATLSGAAPDRKLKYAWTVNGEAQGSDSPDLTYTPNNTGSFNVQVTVTDTTPPPAPLETSAQVPCSLLGTASASGACGSCFWNCHGYCHRASADYQHCNRRPDCARLRCEHQRQAHR